MSTQVSTHGFLAQLSGVPIYNTKAVAQETGIPADTFRAWERRYGVPQPHRTDGGHRLYSERDIAIIRWLRDRTAEGLTISQAISLLNNQDETSHHTNGRSETDVDTEPHTWKTMVGRLVAALSDYDEKRADYIISEAFALYSVDDVLHHLVSEALITIGQRWHDGEVSVAVEHFASQFFRRKVFSILNTYASSEGRGMIVVGCAPGELHEVGALIFATLLVRHGWHVVYLGAQVPHDDLLGTIRHLHPDMVCLSASSLETARELVDVGETIAALPQPRPHFCVGGRAFETYPHLLETFPGTFLGNAFDAVNIIHDVLQGASHKEVQVARSWGTTTHPTSYTVSAKSAFSG